MHIEVQDTTFWSAVDFGRKDAPNRLPYIAVLRLDHHRMLVGDWTGCPKLRRTTDRAVCFHQCASFHRFPCQLLDAGRSHNIVGDYEPRHYLHTFLVLRHYQGSIRNKVAGFPPARADNREHRGKPARAKE
jgi:hypothetical protein